MESDYEKKGFFKKNLNEHARKKTLHVSDNVLHAPEQYEMDKDSSQNSVFFYIYLFIFYVYTIMI